MFRDEMATQVMECQLTCFAFNLWFDHLGPIFHKTPLYVLEIMYFHVKKCVHTGTSTRLWSVHLTLIFCPHQFSMWEGIFHSSFYLFHEINTMEPIIVFLNIDHTSKEHLTFWEEMLSLVSTFVSLIFRDILIYGFRV